MTADDLEKHPTAGDDGRMVLPEAASRGSAEDPATAPTGPASVPGACCGAGTPSAATPPVDAASAEVLLQISGMCCAAEESEIRQALNGIQGLRLLRVLPSERCVAVLADDDGLEQAEAAIRRLGYDPVRRQPLAHVSPAARPDTAARQPWRRLIAALLLATAAELLHNLLPPFPLHAAIEVVLAVTAIVLAGLPVYFKGLAALRMGRLNVNALMTVAVSGAFLIGHWPEAAMVMALFALAEALEARAADRARQAIRRLMELAPEQATLERRPGEWVRVAVEAVAIGQRLRVDPGERVPLDGVVETGSSSINQAPVTGESLPVEKEAGDPVYAGTINGQGSLIIRARATAAGSTIARIIAAVEEAQASRAPIQRLVDRFAARYTPAVFLLALAVALFSPALLSISPLQGIYRALVLLVIACPCALVIATPVTLVSGLTTAARQGIVIKGGLFLEQARRLAFIAFDKTGTITTGHPRLVAFEALSDRFDGATLRRWTTSLAGRSDHPVSRAIAGGLKEGCLEVENFEAIVGRGVRGVIQGKRLLLANPRWIRELGLGEEGLERNLMRQSRQGRSLSLLADEEGVLALLAVADQVRPTAAEAVARLRTLGLTPVMLTGDNATTAAVIAAEAGIEQVRSTLLPEQKLEAIADLGKRGPTAMVGDGINDAPALAGARIGFAMGAAGSDAAMEAADIVIMDDDPLRLVDTVVLSRRTVRILWQNILLAVGIKGSFLVLTLLGSTSMWQAVFADMGTSLLVIANGLRLLRHRFV